MARMPDAEWRPLAANWDQQPLMSRYDLVVIHTMVGSLEGTDSYFRSGNGAGFAGTEAHFGTGYDGEIRQWQDTARRADANGDGNHRIISVENADFGTGFAWWDIRDGSQVPAFTAAQIESIAQICAWANKTHGIPLVAATDSGPTTRGVGFHRLGVDPYRASGGELWSSSYGKVCPGARRIAQIPQIISRARELVGGIEEDDMTPEQDKMLRYVYEHMTPGTAGVKRHGKGFEALIAGSLTSGKAGEWNASWGHNTLVALQQQVAALTAACEKLADGVDNADELKAAMREVMAEVVKVEVSVEAPESGAPTPGA